ncbi:hypothetical protein ONZ45_g1766 [Pleurotus djamor]|nr:hypothetical protein ONZ45_g1766 [Pleurotus djamor]
MSSAQLYDQSFESSSYASSGDPSHFLPTSFIHAPDEDIWESLYRMYTSDFTVKTHFYYPPLPNLDALIGSYNLPSSDLPVLPLFPESVLETSTIQPVPAGLRSDAVSTLSSTMALLNGAPPSPDVPTTPQQTSHTASRAESLARSLSPLRVADPSPFEKTFASHSREWSSNSHISPVVRAPSPVHVPSHSVVQTPNEPRSPRASDIGSSPGTPLLCRFLQARRTLDAAKSLRATVPLLSPLTPLTQNSSPTALPIRLKRKRDWPISPTPCLRKRVAIGKENVPPTMAPALKTPTAAMQSSPAASSPLPECLPPQSFPRRSFPDNVEISERFPLFYRQFPPSSYYQTDPLGIPVFDHASPGGLYNPPRGPFDLYTPRYVKGKGREKVGLCPICVEPLSRGGEGKRLWLSMKFSAFKCYHMQYAHGVSAMSGRPFSPPVAFRIAPRPSAAKKEKTHIQQGKCHKCRKWIAVEGIKDADLKVKEIIWWKHAASCHQGLNLDGEKDVFVEDSVFAQLSKL